MIEITRGLFGINPDEVLQLYTKDLEICKGTLTLISPEVWPLVYSEITSVLARVNGMIAVGLSPI